MAQLVFRILWPYLARYVARYAADYLTRRRQRRLQPVVPPPTAAPPPPPPTRPGLLARDGLWYTLSGIILGSALTVALTRLMGRDEPFV